MNDDVRISRWVLARDILIFQLKLYIGNVKDLIVSPFSIIIGMLGILFGGEKRGRAFYALLRRSEHFDQWLNMFVAAEKVGTSNDGLFGASPAGSDSFLGQLEQHLGGNDFPEHAPAPSSAL